MSVRSDLGHAASGPAADLVVPFLDLGRSHGDLKDSILEDLAGLIDANAFIGGKVVTRFEEAFARFCGRAHAVGVSSGLDALRLALLAAGLRPGDEVIVPAQTFVATVEAVRQAGGRPVLADVGVDGNLDPQAAAAAVTGSTRFLLPVHLFGQLADVVALEDLAASHGLEIVEDACQAHGARRDGRRAGAVGLAAAFSFYPGKNLGAMGDAGAVVTVSPDLAERVRALREHGQTAKYQHDLEGYTARLDAFQAAVLLRKLPYLDSWNDERRAATRYYDFALSGVGDLSLPVVAPRSTPAWHLYVVRTAAPDRLAAFLRERGVMTGRHYPTPVHLTGAYASLGYRRGMFPRAEALAEEALSLPLFPGITLAEQEAVVAGVEAYFAHGG